MPKKILFIDDDMMLDKLITRFMQKQGGDYEMISAHTGSEGIEKAKTMAPDAIILDIILPEENGWEIAEQLRNDPATKDIPIIVASGAGSPFDDDPYIEHDLINGYLRKPYDIHELMDIINKAISQ